MTGSVTVLQCLGRDHRAAKRFDLIDGKIVKRAFNAGKYVCAQLVECDGIRALGQIIDKVARYPRAFIVRGTLTAGANRKRMRRIIRDSDGDAATIQDRPGGERWIPLDYDGIPVPAHIDMLTDPGAAVALAVAKLPEPFRGASYYWQLSSSAGFAACGKVLKAHVFYYADRGVSGPELRAYFISHPEAEVDRAVFTPNQLIYTAAPILGKGIVDPVQKRSGFFEGDRDVVVLPEINVPKRGADRDGDGDGFFDSAGIEAKLTHLGDLWVDATTGETRGNPIGEGFRLPLLRACASYAAAHGPNFDRAALKTLLRQAIDDAPVKPTRDREDLKIYASDEWLDDRIESGIDKFASDDDAPIKPTYPAPIAGVEEARAMLAYVYDQHLAAVEEYPAKVAAWNDAEAAWQTKLTTICDHCGGWLYPAQDAAYAAACAAGCTLDEAVDIASSTVDPIDSGYDDAVARYVALVPGFAEAHRAAAEAGALDELWNKKPPPPVHGAAADVGIGKTLMWRERIAAAVPGACLAIPRHALGDEIVSGLAETETDARVYRGLEADDPEQPGKKMCHDLDRVMAVLGARCDFQEMACGPDDPNKPRCAFRDACGWQRQKRQMPGIWIVPHALLLHPRPKFISAPASLTIDEAFHDAGLRGFEINDQQVLPISDIAPAIVQLSSEARLRDALAAAPPGHIAAEIFAAADLDADSCTYLSGKAWEEKEQPPVKPSMPIEEAKRLLAAVVATNARAHMLVQFWKLAADSIRLGSRSPWLEKLGDSIRMRWRADIHASWLTGPVLLLDATMLAETARQYFPNLGEVPVLRVAMPHVRIRQVRDKVMSKSMTIPMPTASERKNDERRRNVERLRRFIEVRASQHRDVLILCHKGLKDELRSGRALPANCEIDHFNNITGIDRWKNVSSLIIIGRTEPGVQEIEARARALFGVDVAEINPDDESNIRWMTMSRGIRLRDGRGVQVVGNYHPDARVEALRWTICEGGLLQAIGRGRGVNRTANTPLKIDILTNVCLPIEVDRVMTWEEIQPSRFEVAAARGTAMPLSNGELARCFPDLWPSEVAVRKERAAAGLTGPRLLWALAPASFVLVSYRRQGQRGSATTAIVAVDTANVRSALEAVVGPVTAFRAATYRTNAVQACSGRVPPPVKAVVVRMAGRPSS